VHTPRVALQQQRHRAPIWIAVFRR